MLIRLENPHFQKEINILILPQTNNSTMPNKTCFACDLKFNPGLIAEYIQYHKNVWPEILDDIKSQGIKHMEIFHVADRLFMIVTPSDGFEKKHGQNSFSWEKSAEFAGRDEATVKKLNEWEDLMDVYQKRLPEEFSKGVKWVKMENIFSLE
jgi:L-rhamnose mutarotase